MTAIPATVDPCADFRCLRAAKPTLSDLTFPFKVTPLYSICEANSGSQPGVHSAAESVRVSRSRGVAEPSHSQRAAHASKPERSGYAAIWPIFANEYRFYVNPSCREISKSVQ